MLLLSYSCKPESEVLPESTDFFELLDSGADFMLFLTESKWEQKAEQEALLDSLLVAYNLVSEDTGRWQISNDTLGVPPGGKSWQDPKTGLLVQVVMAANNEGTGDVWKDLRSHIGRYTGISAGRSGTYYVKMDSILPANLNAVFRIDNQLFALHQGLSFPITSIDSLEMHEQMELHRANQQMTGIMQGLLETFVPKQDRIYAPTNGRLLTETERTIGLVHFWTEVKYNFAFFNQVPELDWDAILQEYLPKVREAQTNLEYYKLLQEVCALLEDGHTNVYLPPSLDRQIGTPPLEITYLEKAFYVTNAAVELQDMFPLGSQILEVDEMDVSAYANSHIRPYIASSTDYIRDRLIANHLLDGMKNTSVSIKIATPDGEILTRATPRNGKASVWVRTEEPWKLAEFRKYGDIGYLALNSFDSYDIVDAFTSHLDSLKASRSIILDLRNNGGGNSGYGYEILKYLSDQPMVSSKWQTREHKAAYKAWGSFLDADNPNLGSWDRQVLPTFQGDNWYVSDPDTILPNKDQAFIKPTIVLIGNNTASAAEDFLIAADKLEHFVLVGQPTFGSTGQPLSIRLPGGGSARICTKKDTYPDGREFVGYGVQPDILVPETLEDLLSDGDTTLEWALNKHRE